MPHAGPVAAPGSEARRPQGQGRFVQHVLDAFQDLKRVVLDAGPVPDRGGERFFCPEQDLTLCAQDERLGRAAALVNAYEAIIGHRFTLSICARSTRTGGPAAQRTSVR